ncbi:MAG: hypothetical protein Q4F05_06995 [bacterium]|nr:hypothetical protein [bacterium]
MEQKRTLEQQLYTIAFMGLAVKNILDSSLLFKRPEWVDTMLLLLFFGVIIAKLGMQSYTKKQILSFTFFGLICIYTCFKMKYFYLIFSFLGIIAVQNVNLKDVMKYTSYTKTVMILIHVIGYILATLTHSSKVYLVVRNGVARHFFFLGHPNTFSMYVLWASLEYLYAKYDEIKTPKIMFVYGINLLTYYFTNSNTGLMVSTLVVFFILLDKMGKKKIVSIIGPMSKYSFAIFSVFFPGLCVMYTRLSGTMLEFYNSLNEFFTGRLLYGAYVYDVYGLSILGKVIKFPEKSHWRGHWLDTMVFDNAYIWLFVMYGSVYLVILSVAFILIAKKTTTQEKIFIVGLALYGIMEAYVINASSAFPLLFIGKYIYDQRKNNKKLCSNGW